MRFSVRHIVIATALLLTFGASTNAAVFLSFTNNGATPTSVSVSAGSSFSVEIKLTSTTSSAADMVTALDYYLQSDNAGNTATVSGIFTIASRNTSNPGTSGTPFGAPYETDSAAAAGSGAVLNPQDATDVGATLTNGYPTDPAVSNTTVVVADYVIAVKSTATPGTYTLTTYDPNSAFGQGYSDTGNNNHAFASSGANTAQGAYSVTVTPAPSPEPASAGLLVIAAIAGLCRRRRRAVEIL